MAATIVPLAVVACGGILAIAGAWVFDMVSGTGGGVGQWLPSGVSAAAGWLVLVLIGDAAWQVWQIASGDAPIPTGEIGTMNETVRRALPPVLLGAGIILGYLFFK